MKPEKEFHYRKSMIPKNKKPTKEDLMRKHRISYSKVYLEYERGDIVDRILNHLKKLIGGTKNSIMRNALFSYYNFMLSNLDKVKKFEDGDTK